MNNEKKPNDERTKNTMLRTANVSSDSECENTTNKPLNPRYNQLTAGSFILKSKKIHGTKYDYSNVVYTNNHTKVGIVCKNHETFFQTPMKHLMGRGCSRCANEKKPKSLSEFIKDARRIHGNRYDYSKSQYINGYTKIEIICQRHGSFWQLPENHFNQRQGCPKCGYGALKTTSEFINQSRSIHGNLYNYSKVDYTGRHSDVKIICKIHGPFYQRPGHHLDGSGCPKCYYQVSEPEVRFLDYLGIVIRNYKLPEWKRKQVDGIDDDRKIVYEFLGDFWHGNPGVYTESRYNKLCHKTFGELNRRTFERLSKVKSFGYTVKYIWEKDWEKFERGIDAAPNILEI